MEEVNQVAQEYVGPDEGFFVDRVAALRIGFSCMIVDLFCLHCPEAPEAWIGCEQGFEGAMDSGLQPDVGFGRAKKYAFEVERNTGLPGVVGPEVIASGISDQLCGVAFSSGQVPDAGKGCLAKNRGSICERFCGSGQFFVAIRYGGKDLICFYRFAY